MPSPSPAARLAALLAKSSRRLSQQTLRVARALGPGAADVVTEILDRERDPATRTNGRTAGRAALLAQELRLAGAIPPLVPDELPQKQQHAEARRRGASRTGRPPPPRGAT
jgi:hypothetical protein